jgi:hypothetical protein
VQSARPLNLRAPCIRRPPINGGVFFGVPLRGLNVFAVRPLSRPCTPAVRTRCANLWFCFVLGMGVVLTICSRTLRPMCPLCARSAPTAPAVCPLCASYSQALRKLGVGLGGARDMRGGLPALRQLCACCVCVCSLCARSLTTCTRCAQTVRKLCALCARCVDEVHPALPPCAACSLNCLTIVIYRGLNSTGLFSAYCPDP